MNNDADAIAINLRAVFAKAARKKAMSEKKLRSYGDIRVLEQHPEADEVRGKVYELLDDDFDTLDDALKFILTRGREDCTYAVIRLVSQHRVHIETVEKRRLIEAGGAEEEKP